MSNGAGTRLREGDGLMERFVFVTAVTIAIIIGVVAIGGLLFWQAALDGNILAEMEAAGVDTNDIGISFANLAFLIYFCRESPR